MAQQAIQIHEAQQPLLVKGKGLDSGEPSFWWSGM